MNDGATGGAGGTCEITFANLDVTLIFSQTLSRPTMRYVTISVNPFLHIGILSQPGVMQRGQMPSSSTSLKTTEYDDSSSRQKG